MYIMPLYGFLKRLSLENDKKMACWRGTSLSGASPGEDTSCDFLCTLRKVVSLEQQRLLRNKQDSFPWKNLPPTKSLRNKWDTES